MVSVVSTVRTCWVLLPPLAVPKCSACSKITKTQHAAVIIGCLEGQGDLVSMFIRGIIRVIIWVIGAINLVTNSP